MSDVEVAVAAPSDLEPARSMLRAAYAEYESALPPANWALYLEDIIDLEGRAPDSDLLVAKLDGKVAACVSYFPPGSKASYPSDAYSERWPDDWSAVRLLAVDPAIRGRGLGRILTEACIERARKQAAAAVGLHTVAFMAVARAMYERMGFERAPQYDFRPGPNILIEAYRLELGSS